MRDRAHARYVSTERRRSSRIDRAVPITVTGVDAVGQSFKERTTTINISCHGCRYQSKHYITKDAWVTMEVPNPDSNLPPRSVRARIRWVERSKAMRDPFQINAEFEAPANVWGLAFPPEDWLPFTEGAVPASPAEPVAQEPAVPEPAAPEPVPQPQAAPTETIAVEPPSEPEAPARPADYEVLSWPETEAPAAAPPPEPLPSPPPLAEAQLPEGPPLRRALDKALLATLEKEARPLFDELAGQAVERVTEEISSITLAAQAKWVEKLDAGLAAAEKQWNQRIEAVLGTAVQGASERLAQLSQAAAEQEKQIVARVAGTQQSLAKEAGATQQRLESVRTSLRQEMAQLTAAIEQIRQMQARASEQAALLESAAQSALAESRRRFEKLVGEHNTELEARTKNLAGDLEQRWQKALETAERSSVARMVAQVEQLVQQKLTPHIGRAERVAQELVRGGQINEETLQAHRERLRQAAEDALHEMIPEFQKAVTVLQKEFQETSQAALKTWLAETEAKGSEVTHNTFEGLYKTSEWYQKKAQTAIQSALDRGLEDARNHLRQSAGEVSRLFASELDHYSRSYAEHTHQTLEEAAGELEGRTRQQIEASAQGAVAQFDEQVRATAAQNVERFSSTARTALEDTSAQLDARVKQARQEWASELAAFMDTWRGERATLQREWLAALTQATRAAVQQYQQQLEKAAGESMMAGLNALRERAQHVVDQFAHAAEQHLRETCSQVFAGVAESFRRPGPRLIPDAGGGDPR